MMTGERRRTHTAVAITMAVIIIVAVVTVAHAGIRHVTPHYFVEQPVRDYSINAVCDVKTGTTIYVVASALQSSLSVAVVPNSCERDQ